MTDPTATLSDGAYIQRCYALAEQAAGAGNHPFGAVLVCGSEIRAEAVNEVVTGSDVTRHAERLLVARAWGRLGEDELARAVLYASTEPCVMCAGSIHYAGVRRVVFGVSGSVMAAATGRPYTGIPLRDLVARAGWGIEVVGPVMEDDGRRLHAELWPR